MTPATAGSPAARMPSAIRSFQTLPKIEAEGLEPSFVAPVRQGALLVADAAERVSVGRSGIYDVTVRSGNQVVAEFRGRSRAAGRLEDPG